MNGADIKTRELVDSLRPQSLLKTCGNSKLEFLCGTLGEGKCHYLSGGDPISQQTHNALGDHLGFA
jgi:hypothetical protein